MQLAKAEKLKPLEVELRRLEDLSKSIVDDFAYMRAREEEMRDTNGRFWPFSDHQLTPIPLSEFFFPAHPSTPKTHPHLFFNMPMDF